MIIRVAGYVLFGMGGLMVIVETTSSNLQSLAVILASNSIDEAMLAIYPAGPPTCKLVAKWLRFSDAFERIAHRIADEFVHPAQDRSVRLLPMDVVRPRALGPEQLHFSTRFRSSRWPAFAAVMDSARWAAFAGVPKT